MVAYKVIFYLLQKFLAGSEKHRFPVFHKKPRGLFQIFRHQETATGRYLNAPVGVQVPVGLAEECEVYLGYTNSFEIKRIVVRIHQGAAFDDQIILLGGIGTPSIAPNSNRNIVLRQELHIASTIPLETADKADIGGQPGPLPIIECLWLVMIRIKGFSTMTTLRAEIRLFLRIGVIGLVGKDHIVILQAARIGPGQVGPAIHVVITV